MFLVIFFHTLSQLTWNWACIYHFELFYYYFFFCGGVLELIINDCEEMKKRHCSRCQLLPF